MQFFFFHMLRTKTWND